MAMTHRSSGNPLRSVALLAVLALLAGAGCTEKGKRVTFDGKYYPVREKGTDKADRAAFQVTVRRADQGLDGAREAGRRGGSKYCIKNFGTSAIAWERGPDDDAAQLPISNGALVLTGRCVTW